ncbi:MAG: hypothetical protein Q9182_005172 [Xanthomendoza sp. 2 TL-2023]
MEDMLKGQVEMTDQYIPQLKALAPDSAAYLNEADWRDPQWKEAFYGTNYAKLKSIKAKYDPYDIFYAPTAVGSDSWVIEDPGKLCRVESS